MDVREELKTAGVYPSGPCSAWPKERNEALRASYYVGKNPAKKVKASPAQMAGGLLKSANQALRAGRTSEEIRNERYDTCKSCPSFIEKTKRCSECGCFMEAKTWIGGNPDALCPLKKWSR